MYNPYMYDDERIVNPRVGEIILYTVHKGDNVYRIAKTLHSEVAWIQVMNQLDDDLMIYPQQQLLIPIVFQRSHQCHSLIKEKPMIYIFKKMHKIEN